MVQFGGRERKEESRARVAPSAVHTSPRSSSVTCTRTGGGAGGGGASAMVTGGNAHWPARSRFGSVRLPKTRKKRKGASASESSGDERRAVPVVRHTRSRCPSAMAAAFSVRLANADVGWQIVKGEGAVNVLANVTCV